MVKKSLSLLLLLLLWGIVAFSLQNEIILPNPLAVGQRILTLCQEPTFYRNLLSTFFRAHLAFIISAFVGGGLAIVCFRFKWVEMVVLPWIKCLQAVPQISFIILLLFWLNNEQSIMGVVFLMVFPLAYFNLLEALKTIEQDYLDIIVQAHQPWYFNLKKAYLPFASSGIQATLKGGLPLALKVTVMAEVLIHTQVGIGRALSMARANIDMIGVFAWTIVLVGLVGLETRGLSYLMKRKRNAPL